MKSPAKLTFEAILLAAVIVAVLATPLLAEAAHHGDGPPTLEEFDGNGDGFLSEDEFNTGRDERHAMMAEKGHPMKDMANAPTFADFDTNGDGQLSADEFGSGHEMHMRAMRGEHHGGENVDEGIGAATALGRRRRRGGGLRRLGCRGRLRGRVLFAVGGPGRLFGLGHGGNNGGNMGDDRPRE